MWRKRKSLMLKHGTARQCALFCAGSWKLSKVNEKVNRVALTKAHTHAILFTNTKFYLD
jgi:hypothetical protein